MRYLCRPIKYITDINKFLIQVSLFIIGRPYIIKTRQIQTPDKTTKNKNQIGYYGKILLDETLQTTDHYPSFYDGDEQF
jgi:hypothetical protein